MGASPFSEFFKVRKEPAASKSEDGSPPPALQFSAADKLEIIEQLEISGAACFWATDPRGILSYLSPAVHQKTILTVGRLGAFWFVGPLSGYVGSGLKPSLIIGRLLPSPCGKSCDVPQLTD